MDHILLDHTSLIEKLYSGCCFLNDNRLAMWKPLRNARAIQQQRKLPLVMPQKATDGNGQPASATSFNSAFLKKTENVSEPYNSNQE